MPVTARLSSFFWRQSSENADAGFVISFSATGEGRYLNGEFRTPDGEWAEYRDVPVTEAQWHELETALRGLTLPPYAPPDPYLMDATDSCVEIGWTENGARRTDRYNGEQAQALWAFVTAFIGQMTAAD